MITAATKICMVIGHPVIHSLSPAIHNAGYKSLHLDDQFVYVACDVEPAKIADFVTGVRAMGVRGVSCTMPHKQIIMPFLDRIDPIAKEIGAVNTIVQADNKLIGFNTDWIGVVEPLKARVQLKGKKVAIIGAGGAARAMVYGFVREGAQVTVYNRTLEKAQAIADDFDCHALPLSDISAVSEADIICNATSIGMYPEAKTTPLDAAVLRQNQIILDAIYDPQETQLLKDAKAVGAEIIPGVEMLLHQAMAQFQLYTGHVPPEVVLRDVITKELKT